MNSLQFAWIVLGVLFGLLMMMQIPRCKATHNGILSILTASLLGIFGVWYSWVAVIVALFCFGYGLWKNQHKYMGVAHDGSN